MATNRVKQETTKKCLEYPSWVHERLHLSWDFYPNPEKLESDVDASKMSISAQEEQLVDDLLNCMIVRYILIIKIFKIEILYVFNYN